jgi:hypothetical protein
VRILPVSLASLFALASLVCRGTAEFEWALHVDRIVDCPGPSDFVEARFVDVEGHAEGVHFLVFRDDWKERARRAEPEGSAELERRIPSNWLHENDPSAPFENANPSDDWESLRQPMDAVEASKHAVERPGRGQDANFTETTQVLGDHARWECRIFGALASPESGSSLSAGDVSWVEVGTFELSDSLTRNGRMWNNLGSELVVGAGLLLYVGVPVAVWVLLLA